jgi:hypothetical protein
VLGEVTVRTAELLVPGESARAEVFHDPPQPLGTLPLTLKFVAEQEELSLSVMLTVKFTDVPGRTDWLCEGEMATVGFARVQVVPPATI